MFSRQYPNLNDGNSRVTSPLCVLYNCIAWTVGNQIRYIWPDSDNSYGWPPTIPREATVAAFVQFYRLCGFIACADSALEHGYEKVAIFADNDGVQHASRQLDNGNWTSKLGDLADVEHITLAAVAGGEFGEPVAYMRRAKTGPIVLPDLYPPPALITPGGARLFP